MYIGRGAVKRHVVFLCWLLCCLAVICPAYPAAAQTETSVAVAAKIYTLEDCFDLALTRRPEVQAASKQTEADQYGYESAKKVNFPQFEAEYNPSLFGTTQGDGDTRFAPVRSRVAVTQPVYTWGKNSNTISNAEKTVQSSTAAEEEEKLNLRLAVTDEFYDTMNYQELLNVLKEIIAEMEDQLTKVQGFFETGKLSKMDVLEVTQYLERQKRDYRQTEGDLEVALRQLRLSIGFPQNSPSGFADVEPSPPGEFPPFAESIRIAQKWNPTLRQLEINHDVIGGQIEIQKAETRPQVEAYAAYQPQTVFLDQREDEFDTRDIYEIGIKVEWLFFDWGLNSNLVKKLRSLQNKNDFDLKASSLDLEKRLENIYYKLQTIRQVEPMLASEKKRAKEELELSKERYFAGKASYVEVNQVLRDYKDVETMIVKNKTDLLRFWVEFNLLLGLR